MPALNEIQLATACKTYALKRLNGSLQYAWRATAKRLPVTLMSGTIRQFVRHGTEASPRGTTNPATMSLWQPPAHPTLVDYGLTSRPYTCSTYALRDFISDQELRQSAAPLNPFYDAAANLAATLANDVERSFALLFGTLANYNASNQTTLTTGTTSWAAVTSASSSPLRDIATGRSRLRTILGTDPNLLILSAGAADALAAHPELQNMMRYTNPELDRSGIPDALRGMRVVVATATYNAAAPGAAENLQRILRTSTGTECAILAHIDDAALSDRTIQTCLMPTCDAGYGHDISIRTYRDDAAGGQFVQASYTYTLLPGAVDNTGLITSAYIIANVTA